MAVVKRPESDSGLPSPEEQELIDKERAEAKAEFDKAVKGK